MNIFNELINIYPFLNSLDKDVKEIVKNSLVIKKFDPDYTLIREGESCIGLSLILDGSIRVYKLSNTGREATLYNLSTGDTCYLSMSCILSDKAYPAFTEVLQSTTIAFVPSSIFNKYIYNTLDFQKYMVNNLYLKFNSVLNVLEEITFERVDSRIAKYLMLISQNSNNTSYLYLTQDKIAKELGTSREVVSRILSDFKNKSILKSSRGKITILNFDKLKSISNL